VESCSPVLRKCANHEGRTWWEYKGDCLASSFAALQPFRPLQNNFKSSSMKGIIGTMPKRVKGPVAHNVCLYFRVFCGEDIAPGRGKVQLLKLVRDAQAIKPADLSVRNFREPGSLPSIAAYDGFEVLQWIRGEPGLRRLIVIVFTTSVLTADMNRAYDLGANAYLTKAVDTCGLVELVRTLCDFWVKFNKSPICDSH
jgi:CheY-like chemotaxis protein